MLLKSISWCTDSGEEHLCKVKKNVITKLFFFVFLQSCLLYCRIVETLDNKNIIAGTYQQ